VKVGDIACGALRLPTDTPPMFVVHRGPVVEIDDDAVHIQSANTGEPVVVPRMLVTTDLDEALFDLFDYVSTMVERMRGNAAVNPTKIFGWVAQKAAMEADLRASVVIVDCGVVTGEPPDEPQPDYEKRGAALVPVVGKKDGTYEGMRRRKQERMNRRRTRRARDAKKTPVTVH
jgi:hypothetical protein